MSTDKITITDNEHAALVACLNYDDRASQLSDNFSNGDADKIAHATGLSLQGAGGVISSLIQKGLATAEEQEVNGDSYDYVELTELGVNLIFDRIEAEQLEREVTAARTSQKVNEARESGLTTDNVETFILGEPAAPAVGDRIAAIARQKDRILEQLDERRNEIAVLEARLAGLTDESLALLTDEAGS